MAREDATRTRRAPSLGLGLALAWLLGAGGCTARPAPEHHVDPILSGVTVVEPGIRRRPGLDLVVRGERVETIAPHEPGRRGSLPELDGLYVLPGLVDLHVHLPPALTGDELRLFGLLFLAHGVTHVRDTGSFRGVSLDLGARAEGLGAWLPRISACGPFLDGREPAWPGSRVVVGPDAAAAVIGELVHRGAACAKLYNGLDRGTASALVAEAARRDLPVVAHVPHRASLRHVAGGEVQHLMGAVPCWSGLGPGEIRRYVDHSLRHGISHTPTLVAFAGPGEGASWPGERLPRALAFAGALRDWRPRSAPGCRDAPDLRRTGMERLVAALHGAGVPIGLGTDTPLGGRAPGAAVHAELGRLVQAGLSPEQAWRAGGATAGRLLGREDPGRIREGGGANLLLFREDPTRDLAALSSLEAVVVRGRLVRRSTLEAEAERLGRRLSAPLSRWSAAAAQALARRLLGVGEEAGPP